jgi:hypothetical protein
LIQEIPKKTGDVDPETVFWGFQRLIVNVHNRTLIDASQSISWILNIVLTTPESALTARFNNTTSKRAYQPIEMIMLDS